MYCGILGCHSRAWKQAHEYAGSNFLIHTCAATGLPVFRSSFETLQLCLVASVFCVRTKLAEE